MTDGVAVKDYNTFRTCFSSRRWLRWLMTGHYSVRSIVVTVQYYISHFSTCTLYTKKVEARQVAGF